VAAWCVVACGGQPDRVAETDRPARQALTVADTLLELTDCTLKVTRDGVSVQYRFDFPAECTISPGHEGRPRVVPTPAGQVVIVEASAAPSEAGGWCDTRFRAVIISATGVAVSDDVQSVGSCGPQVWDEKTYHVLASPSSPLTPTP